MTNQPQPLTPSTDVTGGRANALTHAHIKERVESIKHTLEFGDPNDRYLTHNIILHDRGGLLAIITQLLGEIERLKREVNEASGIVFHYEWGDENGLFTPPYPEVWEGQYSEMRQSIKDVATKALKEAAEKAKQDG